MWREESQCTGARIKVCHRCPGELLGPHKERYKKVAERREARVELAQKVSEVEQSQVEWFIQAWATPFLGPQCFRQKKHGHIVFLMRSVQDQTRAQEEGVT